MEKKLLRTYSAWQETHRFAFVDRSLRLMGQILKLDPHYSLRTRFQHAF